jgi:glycosyltransferase involved in cell wall biosynthesis
MKFVLFSPLAASSAIGRVTALVVEAMLNRGHSAVVIRTEDELLMSSPTHRCDAETILWNDEESVEAASRDADAIIHQIGNNYSYHCGSLHWLARCPAIICLHDFLVAHLFAEWAAKGRGQEAARVLTEWYGNDAATKFFKAENAQAFIEMASQSYPMTEWICSMALGVVSHSHWGMKRVAQSCPGPLRVLPLPYDAPSCVASAVNAKRGDGLLNILTVGHVNSNKRIDSVIRAIGSSSILRNTVAYRLCGRIEPLVAVELTELARRHGVALEISGEIDAAVLQSSMTSADIICCLRWPSFEAASATTIEGLLYGRAVVVTDAAFYSELPDDCVVKISVEDEVADLRNALEYLCTHSAAREAMALRGKQWASRTFTARNYVDNLEDLAIGVAAATPSIEMAQSIATQLAGWGASTALIAAEDILSPLELFQTNS